MKSSIYVKRQLFEIRLISVISFVFVAFCQPRILRYSARDVTDIFAIGSDLLLKKHMRRTLINIQNSIFIHTPGTRKSVLTGLPLPLLFRVFKL